MKQYKLLSLLLILMMFFNLISTAQAEQSWQNGRYGAVTGELSERAVLFNVKGRNVKLFSGYFPILCTDHETGIETPRLFHISRLDRIGFSLNANGKVNHDFEYQDDAFRQGIVTVDIKMRGKRARVTVYVNTVGETENCYDAQTFLAKKSGTR